MVHRVKMLLKCIFNRLGRAISKAKKVEFNCSYLAIRGPQEGLHHEELDATVIK